MMIAGRALVVAALFTFNPIPLPTPLLRGQCVIKEESHCKILLPLPLKWKP